MIQMDKLLIDFSPHFVIDEKAIYMCITNVYEKKKKNDITCHNEFKSNFKYVSKGSSV